MACIRAVSVGFVFVILAYFAAPVAAQQPSKPPAVIRFSQGQLFEVPQGWSWSSFENDEINLTYDKTGSVDRPKDNPNLLNVKSYRIVKLDESWTRKDIDRSRTLPNGATARWVSGQKWGVYIMFNAEAAVGSKALFFQVTEGKAKFDRDALEAAVLKIAGSMREVGPSNSIFHPVRNFSVGNDFKNWRPRVVSPGVVFDCAICGSEKVFLNVYPVEINKPFANLDAAFADVTDAVAIARNGWKAVEPRRAEFPGGRLIWTEQPGSALRIAGALERDGRMLYMALVSQGPTTVGMDLLRTEYLAIARTVRPWDGR